MKKRLLGLVIITIIAVLALVGCDNIIVDIKPEQYTVTFDVDGGSPVAPIKVNENGFVTKPEDPTKEGFDFAGWYKDAARTEAWVFDYHKITGNTTLYAKWVDHVHVGGTATCEDSAVCSVCGESYGTPLGHTPVTDAAVAPTCGKDGLTEGSHCDVCGKVLVAQETVPATGNHAWGEWVTDREATEDADGAKHRDCSVCGAKEEGIIPSLAHQHSYKSEVTTAPGCETKGTMTFTCGCGSSYTEEIPATGHAWDAGEITTAPTCVAPGVKTFTCQNDASHTKTEEIPIDPNAHTLVDVEGKAATCEEDGYTAYKKCSNQGCEHTVGKETLPALGHKWNEGEVTVPATYGHKGTKTFTCQNDSKHTKTEDIKQLELADNATAAEIVNAAYSLEKGEALIGEFTLTGVITKVNYTYTTSNGITITIKVTGADESKTIYCYKLVGDDADKIVAGDTVTVTGPIKNYNGTVEFYQGCTLVDYTEHEHQWSEATCKVLATCSICKKTTGEFADHNYGTDDICTVCGHDKNSKEAWVLVTDVAQLKDGAEIVIVSSKYNVAMSTIQRNNNRGSVNVAKDGNTVTINSDVQIIVLGITSDGKYTFFVTGSTNLDGNAVDDGYLYAASSSSNHLKTQKTNDANGTWTIEISESGVATVKAQGSNTRNWLRYNDAASNGQLFSCYSSNQTDISIYVKTTTEVHTCTPADAVKENEVAPTCTAAGSYDEVVYCSECGKEISRNTVTVNALGHTPVVDAKVDATCESTGLTEGSHCSVCGEVIVAQTVVDALGHKWDDGVVTTDPTCEGKGVKTFTCQNDSKHTKTEDVAALGHTASESAIIENKVDATCTVNGSYDSVVYCSVCDDEISRNTVTVPASGHKVGENNTCTVCGANLCGDNHTAVTDAAVAPTCTATGLTEGSHCSKCGEILVAQEVINALGHKEVVDAKVDATCTKTGLTEGKHCSVCNEVLVAQEEVAALGHTPVVDAKVDATCTETGLTEGSHCDVCKEVLTAQEEVPALGHSDENGDYLCDNGCKTLMEPVADSTLTLEEANKLAAAIDSISDSTKYTTNKYYIIGTVKNIANPTYGNPTIVDEDGNEFYSYGMYDTDGETKYEKLEYKPVKGDVVTLYGTIGIYVKNGVASNQMNNGILTNVVPHNHDWSHEATCDNPATCNICGGENVIAHTPSENDLTCSTPIYCTVCREILETEEHVDENKNGKCDVCKADVPISAGEREIVFEFGANGEANHVDGDDLGKSKSYENGEYTLALTEMSKVFGPAYDAKGNSCIKLGTSKVTGGFTFTVPDDVTSVIIYVAGYKGATSTNIKINGTQHTVKTASDNGKYTAIEIDTTTTKTITLVTVTYRAMIDSIVFVVPGNEGAKHVHNQATREENRVESTCTVEGHYDLVTYCSDEDCGEEISRTEVKLDTADHSYVPVVTAPTCEAKGYTTHTCSVCGNNYTDTEVAALGHKEETIPAVAPTCTETGLSEGKKCSVCGTVTKEQETVDALGHTEVTDAAVAATCTATGLTEGKHCSVCDKVLKAQEVVEAEGHKYGSVVTAPTCEAKGYTTHTCSVCGDNYTDTEVAAKGHTEVIDKAVAATCESTGLTEGSHCSVCKKVLKAQTVVEKLDHTPGEAVKEKVVESTCTSKGSYELAVYCSVCKKALSRDYITTPVAEHAKVQYEAKAPTCTEKGWNAYETCANCTYTTYVELPALEHIDEDNNNVCDREDCKTALCKDDDHIEGEGEVTTPATCVAKGIRTFKCTACGEILRTEEIAIDENAHNMVEMPGKQKTCTEDGYSTYDLCSLCGIEEGKNVLKAEGHMVNVKVNSVEPTCTEPGKTRGCSCTYCDYEEISEEIPALGHDMTVAVNGKEATCTEAGYNAHTKCSRCDYTEGKEVIPATDHAWDNACDTTCNNGCGETRVIEHDIVTDVAVAATCTETGLTEGKHCSRCDGATTAQQIVPALGHDMVPVDGKPATCTEPGYTAYTDCSRCDHIEGKETIDALNHAIVNHDAKAPTCTEKGWNAYETCSRCDYTTYNEIDAAGHVGGTATCTALAVCEVCGNTYGETTEHKLTSKGVCEFGCGYKKVEGGWILVTDVSQLTIDSEIIIVGNNANYALSTNQKSNNRGAASVTKNGTAITFGDDVQIITLKAGKSEGTFAFYTGTAGYLYAAGSSGNHLKTKTTLDDDGSWTITITNGVASIIATNSSNRNVMQYNPNNGAPLFACYASASQTALQIYVSVEGFDCDPHSHFGGQANCSSPAMCEYCNEKYGEIGDHVSNGAATCEVAETCSICNAILAPATGHNMADATCTAPSTCKNGCGRTEGEALGHTWGDWKVTKEATETEDGSQHRFCTVCDEEEIDVINRLDHVHDHTAVITAPTCTTDGYTTYTCACGDTYKADTVVATGHNDEKGDYKCDACSTIMEPTDGTTLTVAQAITLAKAVGENYTTGKFYITGMITNINNTTYGNMTIRDENGDDLYLYGLYSADGNTRYDAMTTQPAVYDEITVYTVLGTYNNSVQGKNAWLDEHVAHVCSEFTVATCTVAAKCVVCDKANGEALGHTTENGTCERCGNTIGGDAPVLEEKTYSYTFTAKQWSANGVQTLSDVNWTLAGSGGYWGYDATKGQQFGSGSAPYKSMTLTSGSFSNVSQIVINTSGASSIAATLKVYVGSTLVKTITLTKTATDYTIDVSDLTGEIKFEYTQTSSKALYIKSISVTYAE